MLDYLVNEVKLVQEVLEELEVEEDRMVNQDLKAIQVNLVLLGHKEKLVHKVWMAHEGLPVLLDHLVQVEKMACPVHPENADLQ